MTNSSDHHLTRAEQFQVFTETPGLIDEVFRCLANGGDLITFCQPKNIRYADLADWIRADKARLDIFTRACDAGNEWIRARILKEIASLALVDIRELYDEAGHLKPPSAWPDNLAAAIQSIEVDETFERDGREKKWSGFTKKVKFHDKLKALVEWGREHGMFVQKHEHKGTFTLEQLVAASREPEKENSDGQAQETQSP